MDFTLEQKFENEKWYLKIVGEVDIYSSPDLKSQLKMLIEEKAVDLHIDCIKLEYIDSTGLGALVGVLKAVHANNNEMYLYNVAPNILKLFHITQLDKIFSIKNDGGTPT
ncbi:MAG: STAS domain-containing protein [Turicibacter sp.]|nr:STAS domain-containing protein [Turicibacter sp.]